MGAVKKKAFSNWLVAQNFEQGAATLMAECNHAAAYRPPMQAFLEI